MGQIEKKHKYPRETDKFDLIRRRAFYSFFLRSLECLFNNARSFYLILLFNGLNIDKRCFWCNKTKWSETLLIPWNGKCVCVSFLFQIQWNLFQSCTCFHLFRSGKFSWKWRNLWFWYLLDFWHLAHSVSQSALRNYIIKNFPVRQTHSVRSARREQWNWNVEHEKSER